jgi:hypothetical protein
MSDRENDPNAQAIDPPENTRSDAMNMESTEDSAEAIDPPENTSSNN